MIENLTSWTADDCWDPQHREAFGVVDGQRIHLHTVTLHNGLIFVRPLPYDGRLFGSVYKLEDVPDLVRRALAKETAGAN